MGILAGQPFKKAALVQIRADLPEMHNSFGFFQFNKKFSPCLVCQATTDNLYAAPLASFDAARARKKASSLSVSKETRRVSKDWESPAQPRSAESMREELRSAHVRLEVGERDLLQQIQAGKPGSF